MKPLNEQITALRNEGYSAVLAEAKGRAAKHIHRP